MKKFFVTLLVIAAVLDATSFGCVDLKNGIVVHKTISQQDLYSSDIQNVVNGFIKSTFSKSDYQLKGVPLHYVVDLDNRVKNEGWKDLKLQLYTGGKQTPAALYFTYSVQDPKKVNWYGAGFFTILKGILGMGLPNSTGSSNGAYRSFGLFLQNPQAYDCP